MAVYVVLATAPSAQLDTAIRDQFPGDNMYPLGPQQWLISTVDPRLTSTISDALGITNGGVGTTAVVFQIASPGWGWHAQALWDWLKIKGVNA